MLKKLLLFFYYCKNILNMSLSDNSKECKIKLLEFYGFEGLMYSVDYKSLISQMNNDYCPNIV